MGKLRCWISFSWLLGSLLLLKEVGSIVLCARPEAANGSVEAGCGGEVGGVVIATAISVGATVVIGIGDGLYEFSAGDGLGVDEP